MAREMEVAGKGAGNGVREAGRVGAAEPFRIVNLTPHAVRITVGEHEVVIPASGSVARIREATVGESGIECGGTRVPVREITLASAEGLPDPEPGVLYLVSRVVAMAAADRDDLVCPGDLIRNEAGQVVGADGLVRMHRGCW